MYAVCFKMENHSESTITILKIQNLIDLLFHFQTQIFPVTIWITKIRKIKTSEKIINMQLNGDFFLEIVLVLQ